MEDTKFRRWLHSQSHFFLNGVLSPCWQLFTTLSNGFWWSVIVSLLFYLPALTTFNFFSLTFLLHFTHLLFDLYFAFSGALSISIWPSTAISICNFSILNCLPLFISSLTIPLYHRPMPSACLILPCPIYACNIISRFRLFSTSATYLYLPCATKLNCWQSLLDFCLLYLLYMATPLTNLRYCIHLLCTQPCTCWLAHIASFILLCIW